nr:immunoglobulin light chain junction region [Macaca mulatta]
CQQGNKLPFSF